MSSNKKNELPDFKGSERRTYSSTSTSSHGSHSSHGSSWTGGGGSGYSTGYSSPTKAFEHDGLEFWGSSKSNLDKTTLTGTDLLINCTGTAHTVKPFILSSPEWLNLSEVKSQLSQVVLDWKDYGVPPESIDLDFWKNIIGKAKENGIKRIIACCTAGHGRTGTALASMALASGFLDNPEEVVEHIRKEYYHKALETKGQELYVWQLVYSLDDETDEDANDNNDDDDDSDEAWNHWNNHYKR